MSETKRADEMVVGDVVGLNAVIDEISHSGVDAWGVPQIVMRFVDGRVMSVEPGRIFPVYPKDQA